MAKVSDKVRTEKRPKTPNGIVGVVQSIERVRNGTRYVVRAPDGKVFFSYEPELLNG